MNNFKEKMLEIYDSVSEFLIQQNRKSIGYDEYGVETGCKYRGDDGLKCAVGFLIKDAFYKEEFENKSIKHHKPIFNAVLYSLNLMDLTSTQKNNFEYMLVCLQMLHDDFTPYNTSWVEKLSELRVMLVDNMENW